jgi:chitin disaccharide deacetylase
MKIIINADDLGFSNEVNNAIFALISRQLVTSSTIMANAPAFEDAVEKIHRHPKCSYGIHLNITEFPPLTANPGLKSLLDEDKNFRRTNLDLSLGNPLGNPMMRAIFEEWCAQIDKVRSHGIEISHIDSHDHMHIRKPQLFIVLKWLQKKYDLNKVRISRNIYSPRAPIRSNLLHYKKKLYNYAIKKYYPSTTTSGFTDFVTFLEVTQINKIPHKSIELSVHPGNPQQFFVDEVSLLKTSWIDRLKFNINLISYNEL